MQTNTRETNMRNHANPNPKDLGVIRKITGYKGLSGTWLVINRQNRITNLNKITQAKIIVGVYRRIIGSKLDAVS